MPATTPHLKTIESLAPLASRYVDVGALPWQPTRFAGVEVKILFEDKERGLCTQLVHMAPGATLTLHEHVDIEQTYVLEGSLKDEQGEATQGNFVWRPAGSRHVAYAPKGAMLIGIFQQPNTFF